MVLKNLYKEPSEKNVFPFQLHPLKKDNLKNVLKTFTMTCSQDALKNVYTYFIFITRFRRESRNTLKQYGEELTLLYKEAI